MEHLHNVIKAADRESDKRVKKVDEVFFKEKPKQSVLTGNYYHSVKYILFTLVI